MKLSTQNAPLVNASFDPQSPACPQHLNGTLVGLNPPNMNESLPGVDKLPDELLLRIFKLTRFE